MITGGASIPRSAGRQLVPKALLATTWLVRWGCVLAPALVALMVGLVFTLGQHGTPDDDGYIYYQYARNLANGFGDGKALATLLQARNARYLVDYTQPEGVGGASNALKYLPAARKVAVIELSEVLAGTRGEYGSYTIYSLKTK